jgi:hypothetical protein
MAWFRNHYECPQCGDDWSCSWSCMCDSDCPGCGFRHISPYDSDDLTEIVRERGGEFVVLRSPNTAEHRPDYQELAKFSTREQAEACLENCTEDVP